MLFQLFATGIGVVDITGVVDIGGALWLGGNISAIFLEKLKMTSNVFHSGLGEDDSWKNLKQKISLTLSL